MLAAVKLLPAAAAASGGEARNVEAESCDESEPRSEGGVGSEVAMEIEGSEVCVCVCVGVCDCDCDCCMAGALLIEAIEAMDAECERLDSDEGELQRMGGVGGRNTRLYSAELWRALSIFC